MARFGILAVVVACGLGYFAYSEGMLLKYSSETPEEITCEALIARGADGNANLVLTNYVGAENIVHETKDNNRNRWTQAWVPLMPSTGQNAVGDPNNVKILLSTTHAQNVDELNNMLTRAKMKGMVTNRIVSLKGNVRDLLKESYPATDFDKCIIFHEGRTPTSSGGVMAFAGGAGVALLLGIGLLLMAWK